MSVDRADIGGRIREILDREFELDAGAGTLDDDTGLLGKGIGLDSVEVLTLVSAIEETFGLTIDDDELEPEQFATIGTIIDFVARRLD